MANTNFASLTTEALTAWSRDFWKVARNQSFLAQVSGTGPNAVVQRITELKKSEKGARAVVTLIPDLEGDGVTGDYTLEGNEEAIKSYDQVIRVDQLRNANRLAGKLADQKSVVNFREESRDVLAYWVADRQDQVAILAASGIALTNKNSGGARAVLATGRNLSDLEFAADVSAPTANRHRRWDNVSKSIVAGDTAAVAAGDKLTYAALVQMKAYAKTQYVKGVRVGGKEMYHVWVSPMAMAQLRLDPDYQAILKLAAPRSESNELFTGAEVVTIDGLVIHEHRHIYRTTGAAGGSKWGAAGAIDGSRCLFLGAQALAWADIGTPTWEEWEFDYRNQPGISIGKIFGVKKPKFMSQVTGTVEDFGLLALDVAI